MQSIGLDNCGLADSHEEGSSQVTTLTIKQAIQKYGLEYLRGKPIDAGGGRVLYIDDRDLDHAIELWADEPQSAHLHRRFYGAEVRNNPTLCVWIYASARILESLSC